MQHVNSVQLSCWPQYDTQITKTLIDIFWVHEYQSLVIDGFPWQRENIVSLWSFITASLNKLWNKQKATVYRAMNLMWYKRNLLYIERHYDDLD